MPSIAEESALLETSLPETSTLKFVSRGKVRDLYEIKGPETAAKGDVEEYLLFVATDRISAFDVVLKNGVPGKGALLTQLSIFWFNRLSHILPNHLVASSLDEMPLGVREQVEPYWKGHLEGRTLLVRKAKVVKLEAIVRGYITGSAWNEYKKSRTVHGIPLPEGLVESAKLPEPLFTPSTKAEQGEHDENISPERARGTIGDEVYKLVSLAALALFKEASEYALSKGLILADTKFEFGLVPVSSQSSPSTSSNLGSSTSLFGSTPSTPTITIDSKPYSLILVDEILTPDSSRYWTASNYEPGRPQTSFDKQYLRDWLLASGFRKGLEGGPEGKEGEGWRMTREVVEGTRERYREVVRILIG